MTLDPEPVLRALLGANVQFVVVGEPETEGSLRLVVSTHPTNLDALGRVLDALSATVRVGDPPLGRNGAGGAPDAHAGPRPLGDPLGAVAVTSAAGDLVLFFGGEHASLYAEALDVSAERQLGDVRVRWAPAVPDLGPPTRPTGRALGGRLISLAGRLAQLVDRRAEREGTSREVPDACAAPDDGESPGAG